MFAQFSGDFESESLKFFGALGYQASFGITSTSNGGYTLSGSADLGGTHTCMLMKINEEGQLE